jgi:hypothetical protein
MIVNPGSRCWWQMATVAAVVLLLSGPLSCREDEVTRPGSADANPAASEGGTTYYVDSQSGDDANSGTSAEEAWRSLDRVNSVVFAPGDEVLFRAGTRYTGQLRPQGSGKAGAPIIIDMFGEGPKPAIDGEGRYPETVLLRNVEYWELRNLEITNTGETRGDRRSGVVVALEDFGTARHIHLKDLYVHDVNSNNVKEKGGGGIRWYCAGKKVKSRFDGLVIEGCHLVRTDRNGITGWSDHWTRPEWHPSLNVVIRGNLLEDIGGDGIVPIGCDGALVEHNVLRGGRMRAPDYAAGIWPWSCDNTIIQFNEVSGMKGTKDGQGFDSDWNCQNTLIQYNYSHDNEGGFLLICNNGDSKPPHNIGNVGTVVRYNISQNDGARTFQISAVEDTTIHNNTIYIGSGMDVHAISHHSWGGYAKDTRFYNNIFYADGTMRYDFSHSAGNVFDSNVFYGNHVDPPADPRAILDEPHLVSPGSGGDGLDCVSGYRLQEDSPCLSAGVPVPDNGGRDFWGGPVPASRAVDIGAHQRTQH